MCISHRGISSESEDNDVCMPLDKKGKVVVYSVNLGPDILFSTPYGPTEAL